MEAAVFYDKKSWGFGKRNYDLILLVEDALQLYDKSHAKLSTSWEALLYDKSFNQRNLYALYSGDGKLQQLYVYTCPVLDERF